MYQNHKLLHGKKIAKEILKTVGPQGENICNIIIAK